MFKNAVAILLSVVVIITIALPSIVVVFDDSVDVSMFYTASEEEKEKNQEKNKEIEFIVLDIKSPSTILSFNIEDVNSEYYFKMYQKPHLKLIFPPPKLSTI
ncbi:MAG: hypothetical protein ACON5F_01960 [Jejuia sp.]